MKGENGHPETPEWSPEPHDIPCFERPDRVPALAMPDCELGEN